MNVHDLLIEEIHLGGQVLVASAVDAKPYWMGSLRPGMEPELRDESGDLPKWFKMEVVAIGAAADGGLLIAVDPS